MSNPIVGPAGAIVAILRKVPLFARLEERELNELAALGGMRRFRKEELVFQQGDAGQQFFLILQGKVRIFLQDERGREVILSLFGPEDFFGEMALLDGLARSASAQALSETRAFVLARDDFRRFLERTPVVALKLLAFMSERLRHADEIIENLALLSVKGRLARLLAGWAIKEAHPIGEGMHLTLPMPKTQIAQMLGTSRETVSRMMSEMADEGYYQMEAHALHIPSIKRLREVP